jgi:hypothetical protein
MEIEVVDGSVGERCEGTKSQERREEKGTSFLCDEMSPLFFRSTSSSPLNLSLRQPELLDEQACGCAFFPFARHCQRRPGTTPTRLALLVLSRQKGVCKGHTTRSPGNDVGIYTIARLSPLMSCSRTAQEQRHLKASRKASSIQISKNWRRQWCAC